MGTNNYLSLNTRLVSPTMKFAATVFMTGANYCNFNILNIASGLVIFSRSDLG